jgi:colicin import membrane protein
VRVKVDWSEPGFIVSAGTHAALLLAALVAFSDAGRFDDLEESIPVEVISTSELTQMTQGEREAKQVQPQPKPRADKVADVQDLKPQTALELKREIPTPPARPPDPDKPDPAAAPSPPERPRDLAADAAKAKEEADDAAKAKAEAEAKAAEEAEALEKAKAEKAKAEAAAKAKAEADRKKKEAEAKAKAEAQKLAALAAEQPKPQPPQKPAEETKFDPSAIQKLLQSKEKPQAAASTAQEVNRTASLGTATGNAAKLNPSQKDQLGQLLKEQITACWTPPPGLANAENLKPRVRMSLNQDGSLSAEPVLVNSSGETGFRAMADSALRAVRRCAPFKIPAQFMPFYSDWRDWNITFDAKEMLG